MLHVREIRQEFWPMLRLAAPLALTELGWVAMGVTDTIMVGRLPDSATAIGAASLAVYFVLRRYLQAMGIVKPIVFALISANLVNVLGNWMLIYGHLGFPGLGVPGSAWATCISRIYMVTVLVLAAVYYDRKRNS